MIDIIIRPKAEEDIRNAFNWYNKQKSGLGYRFLDEVESVLNSIEDNPLSWPILYRNTIRRQLLKRFPYSLYYVVDTEVIYVVAVLHQRQQLSRLIDR